MKANSNPLARNSEPIAMGEESLLKAIMLYKHIPNLKEFLVYIMASKSGTLYVGSTGNIISRVYEHKNGLIDGFTKKYGCDRLIYYEIFASEQGAQKRENQIKKYNRKKKEELIKNFNPKWKDIAFDWYREIDDVLPLILRKGIPHRLRRIRD